MVTCYSQSFLDEYEVIEKMFISSKNPNAKKDRDSMARQLRREGWEIKTTKCTFQDLGGSDTYFLSGKRKRPSVEESEEWLRFGCICIDARAFSAGVAAG